MGAIVVFLLIVGGCYLMRKNVTKINEERDYMDSLMGEREEKKSSVESQADVIYGSTKK